MCSIITIHRNIKSASASPGRSRVFSLLERNSGEVVQTVGTVCSPNSSDLARLNIKTFILIWTITRDVETNVSRFWIFAETFAKFAFQCSFWYKFLNVFAQNSQMFWNTWWTFFLTKTQREIYSKHREILFRLQVFQIGSILTTPWYSQKWLARTLKLNFKGLSQGSGGPWEM